jgi:hypothetical protein
VPAQLVDVDLRALGQVVVEWHDVQRPHTGQEVTRQAALCAMFGLLAKLNPLPLATAVLATMGFLDALSSVLTATDRGWAMTVIMVINALQAAAAVAALLLGPKAEANTSAAGYEAYVDYYNQAVRSYYVSCILMVG